MPERYYRVDIQFRNGTSEGFDAKEFDIDVSNTRRESGGRTTCGPPHQVLVLGAIWGGGTPLPRPGPSSQDSGGGALLGVAASKGRSSSTCEGVSSSLRLQYPQADEANLYLRRYPRDLVIGPLKACITLEGSAVASWNTRVRLPDLRSGSERTSNISTSRSRILPATSARIPSLFGTRTSIRHPGSGNPASVTRARITSTGLPA